MNVKYHPWWQVNIGSGNGLLSFGNEALPEPLLTKVFDQSGITWTK